MTKFIRGDGRIAMTKHGEVTWHASPLPSKDGYILLANPRDNQTAHLLSQSKSKFAEYKRIGHGQDGQVFADPYIGNTALKLFHHADIWGRMNGTLADLQVNVALEYGLSRVQQQVPRWRLRAPVLKGAFLPQAALTNDPNLVSSEDPYEHAVWLMERIKTKGYIDECVPPLSSKQNLAVEEVLQKVTDYYSPLLSGYDLDERNMLVERKPWWPFKGSLVLIDNYAGTEE